MCAAIAVARGGARVILVQNSPALGGNQSGDMNVGISGEDCAGCRTVFCEDHLLQGDLLHAVDDRDEITLC